MVLYFTLDFRGWPATGSFEPNPPDPTSRFLYLRKGLPAAILHNLWKKAIV
jgi:hypothetical protein